MAEPTVIASGVWSIYLQPEAGKRVLDGEDTNVTRARELFALAVAEAPTSTRVELVTPSGQIARSLAGTKLEPEPSFDPAAFFADRYADVTPLTDVARGLSKAGWKIRRINEDSRNFFQEPCIEIDYENETDGLIAAVGRLDEDLSRLMCVGWTAEARYGANTGACLLVIGIVVVIA